MTDLNTAYRTDENVVDEDDPLAELARIVSGEPSQSSANDQGVESRAHIETANEAQGIDIEAELLRELGEAEPDPVADRDDIPGEIAATVQAVAQDLSAETAGVVSTNNAEMSLEEQLMAELENSGTQSDEGLMPAPAQVDLDPVSGDSALDVEMDESAMIGRVESIAEEFNGETQPSADAVRYVHSATANEAEVQPEIPVQTNSNNGNTVDDDALDEFFTDNFADLLETEQAKSLDAAPEAAQVAASADFDFSDAFNAELAASENFVEQGASVGELDLENEFAAAFENELNPESAEPSVQASAGAPDHHQRQTQEPIVAFDSHNAADSNVAAGVPHAAREMAASEPGVNPIPVPANSGNGFKMAVAALGLALVAGLGVVAWGSFGGGSAGDEPVVIKADTAPAKIKPVEPTGKQIANQDNQVYTEVAGVPKEEPDQEKLISSREEVAASTDAAETKASDRLAPKEEPATRQATLGISPKKVRTFTVKPDGTIVQAAPRLEPATTQSETQTTSFDTQIADQSNTSAPAQTTETLASSAAQSDEPTVLALDGAKTTGDIGIPLPSPLPAARQIVNNGTKAVKTAKVAPAPKAKPAAPKTQASSSNEDAPVQIANLNSQPAKPKPTVSSSDWKVQVSSQRSRDAAESSFRNIQRRFSSVLGGKSASIQRADVDGKGTFYRVKVLASSKSEASALCSRLKSAGGSCFVTR